MGTILVVDDDEYIRDFLRKSCASLATVIEAADGAQAIAAARWSHPDVVVMDLDMPVIDGFEAARQIKADPTLGDPILIALTGNETVNAVPRARAAGYSYFVRKETNARSFVDTIARLLAEATALLEERAAAAAAAQATAAALPDPMAESKAAGPEAAPARPGRSRKKSEAKKPSARKPARKRATAKKASARKPKAPAKSPAKKSGTRSASGSRRKS